MVMKKQYNIGQLAEQLQTEVEKEDDTQTNIMEEHKKPECFAECFGRYYTNCKQCDNVEH